MKHFELIAAAALVAATAACVAPGAGYSQPYGTTTSYTPGYSSAYPSSYYAPQVRYVSAPSSQQYRDRNHDGIPDARQQRYWP